LDLAKAFDTVNYKILLQLLPSFGIKNASLNWFKSYLINRKQMVKINNVVGHESSINYGVPQGSVLGSILFILYINSICDINIDGLVVTYADDTCLLFSDKSWNGVYDKASFGLNKVYKCLCNRNLTLNEDKTMFMSFSINRSSTNTNCNSITIHRCLNTELCNIHTCKIINEVSRIRYLGIVFDKHLKWNLHIHNLLGKLRTITYKFIKLKNLIPTQTIRIVYFALYQSIYQYGLLIWDGLGECLLKQLQVNQNKIVRICLNKYALKGSTSRNYRDLGVLPVKFLYKKIVIMFIFKQLIKGKNNIFSENKKENMVYNIPVKYPKKSFSQSFVDYLGPTNFNLMPYEYKKTSISIKVVLNNVFINIS